MPVPGRCRFAGAALGSAVQRNRCHPSCPRHAGTPRDITTRIRRRSARSSPAAADSSTRSTNSIRSSSESPRARRIRSIRSSDSCCRPRGRHWRTGGFPPTGLAGTDVGVFVGGFTLDYQLLQNQGTHQPLPIQGSFGHRDDDDDAGEPHLARVRLPRTQHDRSTRRAPARWSRYTLPHRVSGTVSARWPSPAA